MSGDLLVAVLAGSGAMVGWGMADFLAKIGVDRAGTVAALVWAHLFGAVALVAVLLLVVATGVDRPEWPSSALVGLALVGFGVLQAGVYLLVYEAFARGRLSVLNPIFSAYAGVAALVAIVAFGDQVNLSIGLGLLAVFTGVIALSLEGNPFHGFRGGGSGITLILLAVAVAAGWTVLWDQMVSDNDWWMATGGMYVAMSASLLLLGSRRPETLRRPRGKTALVFAGIGLSEVVAYLSIGLGFGTTSYTSVVAVLSGGFAVPAVFLARRFLGEAIGHLQLVGIATVVIGTAAIAVSGGT